MRWWLVLCLVTVVSCGEDYYDILGIGKDADNRQIRKAFKKLALKYHPDKSSEADAQEKFLKINKAYETLKDEEKRKRYDRFGEEDEEQSNNKNNYKNYQSWNYYHDDFGLYDDDPEIVTLDYHDFGRSVRDSYNYWFINFYSPQCSHCHDLAPIWRKVARALNGIVRVGAVNCQDDFILCRQQNIQSYPTLLFFGPDGVMRFQGAKEQSDLIEFVVEQLPDKLHRLRTANIEKVLYREDRGQKLDLPWVILFCIDDDFKCPEKQQWNLLTSVLHGLVNVGSVDCSANKELCQDHTDGNYGTYYFPSNTMVTEKKGRRLSNTEYRELADEILSLLPDIPYVDDEAFSKSVLRLEDNLGPTCLIHFVFGSDGVSPEEKRIPSLIKSNVRFRRVDCKKEATICREYNIKKPIYVCFKIGGGYEYHFGRDMPSDVAEFATKAALARNMFTLTASNFQDTLSNQGAFIDFFAPWCPPCLNLLPEYRKASIQVGGSIVFGLVDCTTQPKICNQFNIRSYPTTIFFNNSKPHYYQGQHNAESLADFVHETLKPSVINLNHNGFYELVGRKTHGEMWLVDFYAPWCGPCMQLAPHWTKLAQTLKKIPEVKVAKVDCTAEPDLCHANAVRSYPSIRMYPMGSPGMSKYFVYTGFHRDAQSLKEWVYESLPSFTENLTPYTFQQKVVQSSRPAIIDFYTPWCGHCQHFAPVFDDIALEVRDKVLAAKVNCERFQQLCSQLGIRAYPTVKLYLGNTDRGVEPPTRNPRDILNFIHDKLEENVKKVTHDEL